MGNLRKHLIQMGHTSSLEKVELPEEIQAQINAMDQRLQTSKTIHQLRRGENNIPAGVNGPLQVGWRQNDVLTPNFPSSMLQGNSNLEKLPLPTTMLMTMTPITPTTMS